ncbi:MAG: ImmA/IrrE family metallo-endopeptidase [Alphaproteobacteria bacterium]|nr:ImmA/IrrE family metallo-endopeptidase [Alphaproteobacteria bacterium]
MSSISFAARPMRRSQIRQIATTTRRASKYGDFPQFDIVKFIELELPSWDHSFALTISPKSEMGDDHARAHVGERIIEVREDVYEGAIKGNGRDRFTLAHEVGHIILHNEPYLARHMETNKLPTYCDPEWQANAFAGELLIPIDLARIIKNPKDATRVFGVSEAAFATQMNAWRKESLL